MQEEKTRTTLAVQVTGSQEPGQFEILAMTAGEGNGWKFSEQVLRDSLQLWEGSETFVDHGSMWTGRSIRDLAGVCCLPEWDPAAKGVKLTLKTAGPSGPLLDQVAREWLSAEGVKPRLGFSADVLFTAKQREVKQILRIISLDLVFNPARGGAFVRALNQTQEETQTMGDEPEQIHSTILAADAASKPTGDLALLNLALDGSHLPDAMKGRIRSQFFGREVTGEALTAAIEDARSLLGELQAGTIIQGPGHISGVMNAEDRLQAAVDDLFGVEREAAMAGAKVERLRGIKELYIGISGDYDMTGQYHKEQAKFATTLTMPNLVKNAMNKIVKQQWEDLGRAGYRWWEPIITTVHMENLNPITGVLVGEVGLLPSVAEGAEYVELPVADSGETGNWTKYGGYLPLTIELIDRDNLERIKSYPKKLTVAATRRLSAAIADVFISNSGAGPVMADTYAVFESAHHGNLGTTALASAEWEVVGRTIYNQSMLVATGQTAPKMAIDPKYLLVPRQLRLAGMQILYPQWERQTNIFSQNMQQGQMGDVITVPEFTDATDWAAVCDPKLAPAIYVGERFGLTPEIFVAGDPSSPAMFANDEARFKVRFFASVFVADYRPMYKENVAG